MLRSEIALKRSTSIAMSVSLWLRFFRFFGLTPSREALLLRAVVQTRFQFVVLTLVAVKENDSERGLGVITFV